MPYISLLIQHQLWQVVRTSRKDILYMNHATTLQGSPRQDVLDTPGQLVTKNRTICSLIKAVE